LKVWK